MRAVELLGTDSPKRVLDLGAGVGRHAIPIAQALPGGSTVTAVDLLPSAIETMLQNARDFGLDGRIQGIVSDLEQFDIPRGEYDLIIACSVLEHVRSLEAFEGILESIQVGTAPGGLNCLVIGADRKEIDANGVSRDALIELPLASEYVSRKLEGLYRDWQVIDKSVSNVAVVESRDDERYTLQSTCVRTLARRSPVDQIGNGASMSVFDT